MNKQKLNENVESLPTEPKKTRKTTAPTSVIVEEDEADELAVSYSKAKKLAPKRPMSDKMKASNAILIAKNRERFQKYNEMKREEREKEIIEQAEKLKEEKKTILKVAPRKKHTNPNHPFKVVAKMQQIDEVDDIDEAESPDEDDVVMPPSPKLKRQQKEIYKEVKTKLDDNQANLIISKVEETLNRLKEIDRKPINQYSILLNKKKQNK